MSKRIEKINRIINTTIYILHKEGASQLSMRKVAEKTDITLSNLQYYFKDRDELLKATIEQYFKQCEESIRQQLSGQDTSVALEILLHDMLMQYLLVGHSNEQCAMFREIWALSTRNNKIEKMVYDYYKSYCDRLVEIISSYSSQPEIIISLLVPYIEGYSIMGHALPIEKNRIVDQLVKLVSEFV